jgi:RNA polymerase sigma factor (sigma-70 family)
VPDEYKNLTDPELIKRCLDGDNNAWEALILRYKRLIYSIAVKFNFQEADSKDVFQAVCLKLLEYLGSLKDERKISAWLITTTTRQCIYLRARRLRESSTDDDYEEPLDPAEDLEEIRMQVEQQQMIREAVQSLKDPCRELIEMLYFDATAPSYEDIAKKLGRPVPSVGPTRARCLEKLQAALRRRGIK